MKWFDWSEFARRQQHLSSLDISASDISDHTLEQMSQLTSLRSFTLNRESGQISDDGLKHLARNQRLSSLRIYNSGLTGSFLSAFSECPLQYLTVEGDHQPDAQRNWNRAGTETLIRTTPRLLQLDLSNQMYAYWKLSLYSNTFEDYAFTNLEKKEITKSIHKIVFHQL